MRIGVGTHDIHLSLQIQILHPEHINIFRAELQPLFVSPPSRRIIFNLAPYKLVEQELSVQLNTMCNIGLKIESDGGFIRAPVFLLGRR